jgi:hypothetical protein
VLINSEPQNIEQGISNQEVTAAAQLSGNAFLQTSEAR